jgi:hypothetical protein
MNGTPLLLSKSTGLAKYCIHNYDSYQFEVDKNELIDIFKKLVDNKADHISMIQNARKSYEKMFTIDTYNSTMYSLLIDG